MFFSSFSLWSQTKTIQSQTNILLILADDLGYSDLGCYGSEIETPNLDALAKEGIRFTQFHTTPLCATTRAALLTGMDHHWAGMGSQDLRTDKWGYEGHLSSRVVTIPQVLKNAGYNSYIAGKWHLGNQAEDDPVRKGFDRSFVLLEGAGNHYDEKGLFAEVPVSVYRENGVEAPWPKGAYSTDFYTDKLIEFIEKDRSKGLPFFAMLTYTSPHWPLQVDRKFSDKYRGKYDKGYTHLRLERLKRLKKAGIVPSNVQLPMLHPAVKAWDSLSSSEKRIEARKMEIYAGMVDNLDYNIGRLLLYLEDIGALENTLIVFLSDNGAAAEDFYHHEHYGPFIRAHFSEDYNLMGQGDSFISLGPQWAEACSGPNRFFKGFTTQGGINTPMIISGKGVEPQGLINRSFLTIKDLAPTFYAIAEANFTAHPQNASKEIGGLNLQKQQDRTLHKPKGQTLPKPENRTLQALEGASFKAILQGSEEPVHDDNYVFALEHRNRGMVKKGRWKIVNNRQPFDENLFRLIDLELDPTESFDLKEQQPEKYKELLEDWHAYLKAQKVLFPTPN